MQQVDCKKDALDKSDIKQLMIHLRPHVVKMVHSGTNANDIVNYLIGRYIYTYITSSTYPVSLA